MNIWSQAFLEWGVGHEDRGGSLDAAATCHVCSSLWSRFFDEHEGAKRLIAKISKGAAGADESVYCALGSPLEEGSLPLGTNTGTALFLPPWALERLGLNGRGESLTVSWFSEEAFPEATRIVLRPHDSAFYHVDAKEELERELTRIGVITEGSLIPISLEVLGGFVVYVEVVKTEPANIVLAHGDEVAIEFEESIDASAQVVGGAGATLPAQEKDAAAAAEPAEPAEPAETFDSLLPSSCSPPSTITCPGRVLGGAPVRYMPDGRPWNPWRDRPMTVPAGTTTSE